jgi:OOP family OmpA-OmpF porin
MRAPTFTDNLGAFVKKTQKIVMAAAILCCAGPGLAQVVNPSWYLQPGVLAFEPDTDFGVDKRDWGASLKIGKPVAPNWDVQLGLTHARADDGPSEYRQTLLGVDALLMISRSRFRPFVLFGLGAQRDHVDNPLRRVSKTSPFGTAGLGFQMTLTERLSLQADLRTVRGRLRDEAAFGTSRSNNKYFAVGLNYALGAPPQPPAPPPPPAPIPQAQAPEVVIPPPPPPAPPPPRFEKVTLAATELFAFNSATLTMPQPRLDAIAAALAADPGITDVDVTGYADRLGKAGYNQKLSERRANAVRDYLIAKGIASGRLKAYGKGEANPVVVCNNKKRADLIKCLEPNRRVEVERITIERRVQ